MNRLAPVQAIIYLDHLSPNDSSDLPGTFPSGVQKVGKRAASHPKVLFLFGLAPDRGYLIMSIAKHAGGLLHLHFTLTGKIPGGIFLWPYPTGCPAPGVARYHALWSADFPRCQSLAARSPDLPGNFIIHFSCISVN